MKPTCATQNISQCMGEICTCSRYQQLFFCPLLLAIFLLMQLCDRLDVYGIGGVPTSGFAYENQTTTQNNYHYYKVDGTMHYEISLYI